MQLLRFKTLWGHPGTPEQAAALAVAAGFGWGMVLFGEQYSFYVWGGTALMAMSVLLLTLGARAAGGTDK